MAPNRERVWVGLFVVIAAGVLAVTVLAVWGGVSRSGVPHRTYFKFSGGVHSGTAVRYGGLKVGAVRSVRIDPADPTRIEVDFVVEKGTPLKSDSVVRLSSLGPLSDSYVEISPGSADTPPLPPDSVLNSTESAGLAQLGDTVQSLIPEVNATLDKVGLTLDTLQTTLDRASDLLNDQNRANVNLALTRVDDLLNDRNRSNLSQSLEGFKNLLSDARPKVAQTLDNLNQAASQLTPLIDNVKNTSESADKALSTLNSALAEDQPDLKASLSELREVLANSSAVMNRLQALLNQNSGNIDEILESMRLAGENIRSLTETLKSSPASLIRGVNVKDRKPGGPRQ
jgi:phospholipid/cholesterol/gamma-HCH transport system substrate-binding protein